MDTTDPRAFNLNTMSPDTNAANTAPLTPIDVANSHADQREAEAEKHGRDIDGLINEVNAIPNGNFFDKFMTVIKGKASESFDRDINTAEAARRNFRDMEGEISQKKLGKVLGLAAAGGLTAFGINIVSIGGIAALGAATFSAPWAIGIGGAALGVAAVKKMIEDNKEKQASLNRDRSRDMRVDFQNEKNTYLNDIETRLNQSNATEARRIVENINESTENLRTKHFELTRKMAEEMNKEKPNALGLPIPETGIQKIERALGILQGDPATQEIFELYRDRKIFESFNTPAGTAVNENAVMEMLVKDKLKLPGNQASRKKFKVALLLLQDMQIPVGSENLTFRSILREGSAQKLSDYFDAFKEHMENLTPEMLMGVFTASDFSRVAMRLPTEKDLGRISGTRAAAADTEKYDLRIYQRFRDLSGFNTQFQRSIPSPVVTPTP